MNSANKKQVTKLPANPLKQNIRDTNKPLKVAAYCRVSTDNEDQLNSYRVQKEYYTEYISKNPKWRFAGIYADEGISGTGVKKRDEFLKMIKDCEKGKIDMIVTKSVSRYARNVVDCLLYTRRLKSMGIGIYFEEQNLDSLKEDTETYLGIYSVLAQAESENISANVKWGIKKRMENGTYLCNMNMLGYRRNKDTKEIYIVPEEAEIVKIIFNMFVNGNSTGFIKEYLEKNNYKTYTGKSVWDRKTISDILQNEKYAGDIMFQKTYRTDCLTKHVKENKGQRDKYYFENSHIPIVDRAIFNMARYEIAKRASLKSKSDKDATIKGHYNARFSLGEILLCGECGSPYRRKQYRWKDKVQYFWRCIGHGDHGDKICTNSKGFEEEKLKAAICLGISEIIKDREEGYSLVMSQLTYIASNDSICDELYSVEIAIIEEKKYLDKNIEMSENTSGNREKFKIIFADSEEKIARLEKRKKEILDCIKTNENAASKIEKIESYLKGNKAVMEEYDDAIARRIVDCVKINSDSSLTVYLNGGYKIDVPYE